MPKGIYKRIKSSKKAKCSYCMKEFSSQGLGSHKIWCKKNPDIEKRERIRERKKGQIAWNKGLTKETDERVKKIGKKVSEVNIGMKFTKDHRRKLSESWTEKRRKEQSKQMLGENNPNYGKTGENSSNYGKKRPEQSKKMMGENNPMYGKTGKNNPSYGKKRPEQSKQMLGENNPMFGKKRPKVSERMSGENNPMYGKTGKLNPMYGRIGKLHPKYGTKDSIETRQQKSISLLKYHKEHPGVHKGEKNPMYGVHRYGKDNPNWNPDREAVYDPYGENFYNHVLRNVRWQLQGGRCLLSGNKLTSDVRQEYHHIDWKKSNDNIDNHVWLISHFHRKVHTKSKRKFYEGILKQNLRMLKMGRIPNSWKEENKIVFKREKMVQTRLYEY